MAASFKVVAEIREASRQIAEFKDSFKASFTEIKSAVDLLKDATRPLAAAFSALGQEIAKSVELAVKQERAHTQLAAVMRTLHGATKEQVQSLIAYNEALEAKRQVEADDLATMQAMMAQMGVLPSQMRAATEAAIGLQQSMGGTISLESAGRKVAQVIDGNVKALSRYGVEAKTAQGAIDELRGRFNALADTTGTTANLWERLQNDLDDARKSFGRLVTDSPEVKAMLVEISDAVRELSAQMGDAKSGLRVVIDSTANAIRFLIQHKEGIAQFFTVILNGITRALPGLNAMRSAIDLAVAAKSAMGLGGGESAPEPGAENPPALIDFPDRIKDRPGKNRRGRTQEDFQMFGRTGLGGRHFADFFAEAHAERERLREEQAAGMQKMFSDAATRGAIGPDEHEKARLDLLKQSQSQEMVMMIDGRKRLRDITKRQDAIDLALEKQHASDVLTLKRATGELIVGTVAGSISGMIEAAASGQGNFARAIGGFVGGAIKSFGELLIQLGTAGLLASALGSVIPIFAGLTGGGLGVGASLAAIGGGVAMVAAGAALGAATGASPARPSAASGGGGGGFRHESGFSPGEAPGTRTPGFNLGGGTQIVQNVINFNGPVGETRRSIKRGFDSLGRHGKPLPVGAR